MRTVLITSIAVKLPMVSAFRQAADAGGYRLAGCDRDENAPARAVVDAFRTLPGTDDPGYADALLALCRELDIGLIVPSRDGDIDVLSGLGEELARAGVIVPLPDAETVALCRDKRAFSTFLTDHGFQSVPVLERVEPSDLPVFYRPRTGAASVGSGRAKDMETAQALLGDPDCLVHPLLQLPEFTIDVLSDFDGAPIQAVVRERRRIVNGESQLTTVRDMPYLAARALELAGALGLRGHTNIQAFARSGNTDGDPLEAEPIFIEANLRFGGASILSVEAGLNAPSRMMALALGEEAERCQARICPAIDYGLTLSRTVEGDRFFREGEQG